MAVTRSRSAKHRVLKPAGKRRRTATPISDTATAKPVPPIWLDLLPPDVVEKIATAVCGRRRRTRALHLAQTSPLQRRAVVSALSRTFSMSRCRLFSNIESCKFEMEWVSCFTHDVRNVIIPSKFARFHPKMRSHATLLLTGPNVEAVEMPDDHGLLRAVRGAASLKDLTVLAGERKKYNTATSAG